MKKAKYNIEDILIGDEVTFYSTKLQSNHDEMWTVTGKSTNQIYVALRKFGYDETWTLDIDEVVIHIPIIERTPLSERKENENREQ